LTEEKTEKTSGNQESLKKDFEEKDQLLMVGSSPHLHSVESIPRIMWSVVAALIPATVVGIYLFGVPALRVISVCVAAAVITEWACLRILNRQESVKDGSAVITGLLLALNLPPQTPSWMCIIGSAFAIIIAKQIFGGLGYNPFNPALAARVLLLIAFPEKMTAYWYKPAPISSGIEAITGATPLGILDQGKLDQVANIPLMDLFLGNINGCIGEVSALALLLGASYLFYRKIITWHIPVSYILTVVFITGILWLINPEKNVSPLFHVVAGGLMIGALFMATDMVTSPVTKTGMLIFGAGCGIITSVIRLVPGGFPEGVSFAILLMNAATPLIDRYTRPRVLGEVKG
jgi:electron transport complex protein RnfD